MTPAKVLTAFLGGGGGGKPCETELKNGSEMASMARSGRALGPCCGVFVLQNRFQFHFLKNSKGKHTQKFSEASYALAAAACCLLLLQAVAEEGAPFERQRRRRGAVGGVGEGVRGLRENERAL